MSTELKVLQRNPELLRGRTLVVGPVTEPETWVLLDLVAGGEIAFLCDDVATHARLVEAGVAAEHAAWPAERGGFDTVVAFVPAGKERLDLQLAQAALALAPDGAVVVLGPNDLGARSAGTRIEQAFATWEKVDFAQRWSLFSARQPLAPDRTLDDFRQSWTLPTDTDEVLEVVDYPGMFSRGSLDEATRMLLTTLPPKMRGRLLDVGAGAGILGCIARRRGASEVVLAETSAVALEGARATVAANGLDAVRVVASDVYSGVDGPFDWIVSNPPFHRQKATDLRVATELIASAPRLIAPGGELRVVANRFLPYAEAMRERFGELRTLADDGRFRVLATTITAGQIRAALAPEATGPPRGGARPSRGRGAASSGRGSGRGRRG